MAITFDEAIEHFKNNTDISGTAVFLDDVEDTLKELRDEYAPTIEMTENQKNAFDEAKRALNTRDLALNFNQEWTILDEVSGNVFGHGPGEATNEQIEAIMQAWLHPETIKVVDDVE